jgi:AcrR family transcriptional regulator
MPMRTKSLAPQQARSRESLRKLLKAVEEVLGQDGLEGATIPRIAAHAGLTPGAIYRRFPDKDALLETTILGLYERQDERLRMGLTPEMAGQIPLAVLVDQLIISTLVSYRANTVRLRAIRQFGQGRDQTAFYKKAVKLEMRSYQYVVDLFLVHRKEIQHPDPKMAITFALMMLISAMGELILTDNDMKNWGTMLPKDDKSLRRELGRSFLSYLGIERKSGS